MKYVSTRGHSASQSFTDILLEGLAPDGGLMVPEQWPRITRPKLDLTTAMAQFELYRNTALRLTPLLLKDDQ
jgi:threonine synthase